METSGIRMKLLPITLENFKNYLNYVTESSSYDEEEIKEILIDFLLYLNLKGEAREIAWYTVENKFSIPSVD